MNYCASKGGEDGNAEYVIVESQESGGPGLSVVKGERQYVAITADTSSVHDAGAVVAAAEDDAVAAATADQLLQSQNVEFLHHTEDGRVIGEQGLFFAYTPL